MNDSDTEVGRIMEARPRPPSSYGSMCSDDHGCDSEMEDKDIPPPIVELPAPTGIRLQRSGSPETAVTSITQDCRSSVHNEGLFITQIRKEQEPVVAAEAMMEGQDRESFTTEIEETETESGRFMPQLSFSEPTEPNPFLEESGQDQLSLKYIFTAMLHSVRNLTPIELLCFVRSLHMFNKSQFEFHQLEQEGELDALTVVDRMLERQKKEEALHLAIRTLNDIRKKDVANTLKQVCGRALLQYDLKVTNKRRYYNIYEGLCSPGEQRFIGHVYVDPPIFIESPGINSTQSGISDLFHPLEGQSRVRVLMTTGAPAIGLSTTVQKFIADWIIRLDGQAEQDFHYLFALPGQELHVIRESELTFMEFLATYYPEAKNADFLACTDCSVLFIIDALQLCRLALDFQNNLTVTDIATPAPPDALLTSLIKGDLLPHACIWITSYSYSARKIPVDYISRFAVLKGFDDARKDEYFTKRTKNPALGVRVRDHARSSRDLYNACYLPMFCWIVSLIYERRFTNPNFTQRVAVLTSFYAQYINLQTNRNIKCFVTTRRNVMSQERENQRVFLLKMGQLAQKMLLEDRDVFYEDEAMCVGLEADDIGMRSGLSYEVGEPAPGKGRSFKFVLEGMLDFMAATFVYLSFRTTGDILPLDPHATKVKKGQNAIELYKPAIERTLASRDGRLDLFLHFLLGLSARGTEACLRGHLLPHYHPEIKGMDEVVVFARRKIKENAAPDRCRNLELCLLEMEETKSEW